MITLALVEQLPKRLDHRVEGVQCWIRVAQRRQCLALLRLQHRGIAGHQPYCFPRRRELWLRGLSLQGLSQGLHQRGAARPAQRGEEGVQHASSPRKPPLLELTPELTTAVAPLLPAAQHIGDIGIQLTGPFPLVRAQGHAAPFEPGPDRRGAFAHLRGNRGQAHPLRPQETHLFILNRPRGQAGLRACFVVESKGVAPFQTGGGDAISPARP